MDPPSAIPFRPASRAQSDCGREEESVRQLMDENAVGKPANADRVIEALQTFMMTNPVGVPLPVECNSNVLYLLEAYMKAQSDSAEQERRLSEAAGVRNRERDAFRALSDEWRERELEYRAEIKRLEVLLSQESDKGTAAVTLARATSVVDRTGGDRRRFEARIRRLTSSGSGEDEPAEDDDHDALAEEDQPLEPNLGAPYNETGTARILGTRRLLGHRSDEILSAEFWISHTQGTKWNPQAVPFDPAKEPCNQGAMIFSATTSEATDDSSHPEGLSSDPGRETIPPTATGVMTQRGRRLPAPAPLLLAPAGPLPLIATATPETEQQKQPDQANASAREEVGPEDAELEDDEGGENGDKEDNGDEEDNRDREDNGDKADDGGRKNNGDKGENEDEKKSGRDDSQQQHPSSRRGPRFSFEPGDDGLASPLTDRMGGPAQQDAPMPAPMPTPMPTFTPLPTLTPQSSPNPAPSTGSNSAEDYNQDHSHHHDRHRHHHQTREVEGPSPDPGRYVSHNPSRHLRRVPRLPLRVQNDQESEEDGSYHPSSSGGGAL